MRARWAAVPVILALALVGGSSCDRGLYPLDRRPEGEVHLQHRERLLAQDKKAERAVRVSAQEHGRLPSGQIQVRIDLESRLKKDDYWLEWKVVFYDVQGFQLEETEWYSLYLTPAVLHTVQASSISPKAEDYTLFLRSQP
jgi:hypothetical protein